MRTDSTDSRKARLLRILPLAIVVAGAVIGWMAFRDLLTFEALAAHRLRLIELRDAHYFAAVAAFTGAYIAIVAFSLPGATVATLTGGFLFGLWPGTAINVMAAATGACIIFWATRLGLGPDVSSRMDASQGMVRRIKQGIDDNQWSMLFLLRLLPLVPFFLANILPALFQVAFHRYAIATYLGIIPGALIYTSIGAGLSDVFAAGARPAMDIIFDLRVLLPVIALCALAALPIVFKLYRRQK